MTICIIGGSSSLGRKLISFGKNKKIIATYNRSLLNTNVRTTQLDLLNKNQVSKFRVNNVEHLIFAQGKLTSTTLGDYEHETIIDSILLNFTSSIIIINNFIKYNCFNENALITFISSISAQNGSYDTVYSAAKSGLFGLCKSIAKHHSPHLRANIICPGLLNNSGMFEEMSGEALENHFKETPTKKLTDVDDLAEIIINLDKKCFSNMNGAIININGGRYV